MSATKGVALVTGASRGIGKAVGDRLTEDGFELIAPTRAEMDLADSSSVRHYLNSLGDVVPNVLILNAGENIPMPLGSLGVEEWRRTMEVNLNSSFQMVQVIGSRMCMAGSGRIVAISSCYSLRAREGRIAYSVSKAGLNALVRGSALEFAKFGLLVNAVMPGFVMTDLTKLNNDASSIQRLIERIPLERLAEAKEVAELVAFLCSERNTYITGQTIAIDGGFLCR